MGIDEEYEKYKKDELLVRVFYMEQTLLLLSKALKYTDPSRLDNADMLLKEIIVNESYDKDTAATKFNELVANADIYIDRDIALSLAETMALDICHDVEFIVNQPNPVDALKYYIFAYISNHHNLEYAELKSKCLKR